jgi:hypothetical protein
MDIEIFDEKDRTNIDKLDFSYILLNQIMKISALGSKELIGGYYKKDEQTLKIIYVPSARDEYRNAIKCLHDLLYPFQDKEYKEAIDKLELSTNILITKLGIELEDITNRTERNKIIEQINELGLSLQREQYHELCKLMNRLNMLLAGRQRQATIK